MKQNKPTKKEAQKASIIFVLVGGIIFLLTYLVYSLNFGEIGTTEFILIGAIVGAVVGGITGLIIAINKKGKKEVPTKNPGKVEEIPISKLYVGPKRNHEFSKEFVEATKYLRRTFYEVSPSSLNQWLEEFKRDAHPKRELAIWMHMAKVYNKVIGNFPNRRDVRKEIFDVILSYSMGNKDYVFSKMEAEYLSKKDMNFTMDVYDKLEKLQERDRK